jgi:transposase-like protein
MSRKYEKVRELLPIIKDMMEKGKSQEHIAKELGLANKQVIWNLLYRERQKEIQGVPKFRGRKPAKTLQEYKYENKRLKMENELLRNFLSLTERK